tara:strand:+ start:666 stop:1103 length:438 start_codon:yes stop_codon:yes gene_type:complete
MDTDIILIALICTAAYIGYVWSNEQIDKRRNTYADPPVWCKLKTDEECQKFLDNMLTGIVSDFMREHINSELSEEIAEAWLNAWTKTHMPNDDQVYVKMVNEKALDEIFSIIPKMELSQKNKCEHSSLVSKYKIYMHPGDNVGNC